MSLGRNIIVYRVGRDVQCGIRCLCFQFFLHMNKREISGWRSSGADDFALEQRDLFISHSSVQHLRAMQLAVGIEQYGLGCWIAPRNLVGGVPYMRQIGSAIGQCQAVVLILTPEAIQSQHVRSELRLAESNDKKIVALKVTDCDPGKLLNPRHTGSAVYDFTELADGEDLSEEVMQDVISVLKETTPDLGTKLIRAAKYSMITKRQDFSFHEIWAEAMEGIRKRNQLMLARHRRSGGERTQEEASDVESPLERSEQLFFESLLLIHEEDMSDPILPFANQLEQLGYALDYLVPTRTDRNTALDKVERASHVILVCGEQRSAQESLIAAAEFAIRKPMIGICVGEVTTDLQYLFAGKHLLRANRDDLSSLVDQIVFSFRYPNAEEVEESSEDLDSKDEVSIYLGGCIIVGMAVMAYLGVMIFNAVTIWTFDPVFWSIAAVVGAVYCIASEKLKARFAEAEGKAFLPSKERVESKEALGCGYSFAIATLLAWPVQYVLGWFFTDVPYWYVVLSIGTLLSAVALFCVFVSQESKMFGSPAKRESDRRAKEATQESAKPGELDEDDWSEDAVVQSAIPQRCPQCEGVILLSDGEPVCWDCGYRPSK